MNQRIDFTKSGGLFIYQDTLDYMQTAYSQANGAIASILGDNLILAGCQEVGGQISPGWLSIGGDIVPFIGGINLGQVIVETIVSNEQFDDGDQKPVYYAKRAKFVSAGGSPWADFSRLSYGSTLKDYSNQVQSLIKGLMVENEVILSGCLVSDINTGASTLSISAGTVLFGGKVVNTPEYSGGYPVYLSDAGNYSIVQPVGSSILFYPHTSQRYVDVLKRAVTPISEIKMYETLSDRFDAAGVGRWEMKGFQLLGSMQGRVPVGLWFDNYTVPNVTDNQYKTAGPAIQGGERLHTLTIAEMPAHNHELQYLNKSGNDGNNVVGAQPGGTSNTSTMKNTGGGQAHNNMQPYTVVVYAKRVN